MIWVGVLLGWVGFIALLHAKRPSALTRWLYALTFECFALCILAILRMAAIFERRKVSRGHSTPILLVHGYLNGGYVWGFHRRYLEKAGFGPIYTISLGHPLQSIESYAKKVEARALEIQRATGKKELILVGHSMGGLVSAFYACEVAPKGSVSKIITIASPLSGTWVAEIAIGHCGRQMRRKSPFIEQLHALLARRSDLALYQMATETDELVIPYTSSLYNKERSHHYVLNDIGHAAMLLSPRVARQLCKWL